MRLVRRPAAVVALVSTALAAMRADRRPARLALMAVSQVRRRMLVSMAALVVRRARVVRPLQPRLRHQPEAGAPAAVDAAKAALHMAPAVLAASVAIDRHKLTELPGWRGLLIPAAVAAVATRAQRFPKRAELAVCQAAAEEVAAPQSTA